MSDWSEFEADENETFFARRRLDSRTYASRSFPLTRTTSSDHGAPARYLYKVFDPASETEVVREVDEWLIRETPAGRYQIKLLVAREAGNVKELWVHRVPSAESGGSVRTLLNLQQPEVSRLLEFLRLLDSFPVEGETGVRLDDDLLRELIQDPDSMARLYRRAPDQIRELIESDASARDVLALAARRREVERFRRLLEDDEYFDSEAAASGRRGSEAVWQHLFESNPWMLGLGLGGQLLTEWDEGRLEQVVVGASIAGSGKRTDALLRTSGRIRSMVFAEIKTHRTPLLGSEYPSGCWSVTHEVSGAVAQVQGTDHRAVSLIGERLVERAADGGEVLGDFTFLLRPKSYLIVGDLAQLYGESGGVHPDKVRSFELFRRHLQEPEILTFDEVLARAEWTLALAEASGS